MELLKAIQNARQDTKKAPVIVAAHVATGNIRVNIGDNNFTFDAIEDRATCRKLNNGLQRYWTLSHDYDVAVVPVAEFERVLHGKQSRIIFKLQHGLAVACEQQEDSSWHVVEIEPGVEDPVDEPTQCAMLAEALLTAADILIDWRLPLVGVTIDGIPEFDGEAIAALQMAATADKAE